MDNSRRQTLEGVIKWNKRALKKAVAEGHKEDAIRYEANITSVEKELTNVG
jgi:hypothetical protein